MPVEKIINKAVAEIAAVAHKMPGVVIIHNFRDWKVVWMSPRGLEALGLTLDKVTSMTVEEYHSRYFNPEDAKDYVPKLAGLLERNNDDDYCTYFQQVRTNVLENWNWHMSSTKILARDEENKPLLSITISYPIDTMHHMTAKAGRLLEENNFLRKNLHLFAKLTKREIDILKFIALGKSSADTAESLFISQLTVETHRKNIRQKLGMPSTFDLNQYARAFDLI